MPQPAIRILLLASLIMASFAFSGAADAQGQSFAITPQEGLGKLAKLPLGPGATVTLKPGTYTDTVKLAGLHGAKDRPIVITAEKGAVIASWKDAASREILPTSSILLEKSNDVVFRNLDIAGASRGITLGSCNNIIIENNNIHDIGNYGVMNYHSSDVTIKNNVIERSTFEHGIYLSGPSAGVRVIGNTIRDTHVNGIHINGAHVNTVVSGNHLERTGQYPTKEGGAAVTLVGGTSGPLVENNTFKDIYGQGITVDAPDAVIKGNTFVSYAWSAILALPHAQQLTIAGNTFQDPKTIPVQTSANLLPTLTASGNRYAANCPVAQERESKRSYSLSDWQGIGKDGR